MTAKFSFSWSTARDYAYLSVGAALLALSLDLFLVPAHLASGGVSGLAQIINYYTGWPIGVMVLAFNVPLFALGWRFLGGPRFAARTAFTTVLFSVLVDGLAPHLPPQGLTHDVVLNVLYGGVLGGFGAGLIYRGRGTSGGTDILARMLTRWRHIPISQSYLFSDAVVMLLAGLTFGWDQALYAIVTLYVSGIAAEAVTEGSHVVRTALVITDRPGEVAASILQHLNRGVTLLDARGGYTGRRRTVLYCVLTRSEIGPLKAIVREADPKAFMVIGHAAEALGEGFRSWYDET
ncbi:MAG: YitT family protein [Chloroflexi bacterium]|nr:YitT family protein [Chloroflexota bacterium]